MNGIAGFIVCQMTRNYMETQERYRLEDEKRIRDFYAMQKKCSPKATRKVTKKKRVG